MAKQAPPRQFPTDSGKDIDTAQISKAFEGRLTPNGDLSPPLSPECFHTLGWEALPLDQLFRVSYISFLLLFCHLLCFLPQRFVVHNGLFARFWTRAKVESSGLSPLLVLVMS